MSMRPWASLASLLSTARDNLDALDESVGTKVVPRRGLPWIRNRFVSEPRELDTACANSSYGSHGVRVATKLR